jgi:hypothetical protein
MCTTGNDRGNFDEMFAIVEVSTQRRIQEIHKVMEIHYPNVIGEEKKILIIYPLYKEGVEIKLQELK